MHFNGVLMNQADDSKSKNNHSPNYQAWAAHRNLDVITASALWCDKSPYHIHELEEWEYVEIRNLAINLIAHQLDAQNYPEHKRDAAVMVLGEKFDKGRDDFFSEARKFMFSREQLKAIAEKIGVKPKFLYLDNGHENVAIDDAALFMQAATSTRDEISLMIRQLAKFDEKAASDIANIANGRISEKLKYKHQDNFTYKKDPTHSELFFSLALFSSNEAVEAMRAYSVVDGVSTDWMRFLVEEPSTNAEQKSALKESALKHLCQANYYWGIANAKDGNIRIDEEIAKFIKERASKGGKAAAKTKKEEAQPTHEKICSRARKLLENGTKEHELVSELSGFFSDITDRQIRNILYSENILRPRKKNSEM